jgi:hypothetical protein
MTATGWAGARRAISPATVVAALIVVAIAASAVALYPTLGGANGQATSSSITSVNGTRYSTTTYNLPPTSSSGSGAPPPTNSSSWEYWAVANVTLGSPSVQAYIHDAYNYSFSISQTGTDPVLLSTTIFVIGEQIVSGNWTTGYNVTYTHISFLNETVMYSPPSYYRSINFAVRNQTDDHGFVNFTSGEREAISSAMDNASLRSYYSANPSYVAGAYLLPAGNATFGGDYLIVLSQLNGTRILNAFVSPASWQVVSTYQSSRISSTCYSNGVCYYSPWGANS